MCSSLGHLWYFKLKKLKIDAHRVKDPFHSIGALLNEGEENYCIKGKLSCHIYGDYFHTKPIRILPDKFYFEIC